MANADPNASPSAPALQGPSDTSADSGADTGTPGADAGPVDLSKGYTIEITVVPGDKIKISVEPVGEEDAEEGSGDDQDDDVQEADSQSEALRVVREIMSAAGDSAAAGSGPTDMQSGYGNGS